MVGVLPSDLKGTSGRPKQKIYFAGNGAHQICKICGGTDHFYQRAQDHKP